MRAIVLLLLLVPATVDETIRLPFRLANRQVHVPVTIDGQGPFWFIIDTGASGAGCIDHDLVRRLELERVGEVIVSDGSGAGQRVLHDVRAPHLRVESLDFGAVDLVEGSFRRPFPGGEERVGILGLELFREVLLVLDYPAGEVEFRLDGAIVHGSGTAIRFESEDEILVHLLVNGRAVPIVVDTGSSASLNLPVSEIRAADLVDDPVPTGTGKSLGGQYSILRAELKEPPRLGDLALPSTIQLNDHHPVGILGFEILRSHRLIVDLSHGLLWID